MVKNIKKSLKYFIIFIGVIIMTPTALYLTLQIPEVQTFLVKRISGHFSEEINSTISVGHFEFKFFNRLTAKDILIKDKNNDTLLYAQTLTVRLKKASFKRKSFRLGRVTVVKPVVALITDSTGVMNLNWYLDLLKGSSDSINKNKIKFLIDQIDISNARFALINENAAEPKYGINFNNLNLNNINGIIEDFKIENDTTAFNIYNLGFLESGGFQIQKMSSSVVLAKNDFLFKSASITCDSSTLNISRLGIKGDSSSFKNFIEKVRLDILFEKSLISASDLRYFVKIPEGINESAWFSGKISGTIAELTGKKH